MIRVCHITSVHRYDDTRIFHKECTSLAEAGYEVHLVAPDAPDALVNGVHLHGVPRVRHRALRATLGAASVVRAARKIGAQVYHFHDPELIPFAITLMGPNVKIVYDVHEDMPLGVLAKTWLPGRLRRHVSTVIDRVERRAAASFAIVTATDTIAERFSGRAKHHVTVNNYPSDSERYVGRGPIVWDACYIGICSRSRAIPEMLEAAKSSSSRLAIAGDFDDADTLRAARAQRGPETELLGYLDRSEVSKLLARTRVGLVLCYPEPKYLRSDATKMFEYMMAGLPIIASNFKHWRKLIETEGLGLCVDPCRPQEIAEAMLWMRDHPEEATAMGERARRLAISRYLWSREAKKLVSFYERILS